MEPALFVPLERFAVIGAGYRLRPPLTLLFGVTLPLFPDCSELFPTDGFTSGSGD
jgi:hypothetical protein